MHRESQGRAGEAPHDLCRRCALYSRLGLGTAALGSPLPPQNTGRTLPCRTFFFQVPKSGRRNLNYPKIRALVLVQIARSFRSHRVCPWGRGDSALSISFQRLLGKPGSVHSRPSAKVHSWSLRSGPASWALSPAGASPVCTGRRKASHQGTAITERRGEGSPREPLLSSLCIRQWPHRSGLGASHSRKGRRASVFIQHQLPWSCEHAVPHREPAPRTRYIRSSNRAAANPSYPGG